MNSKFTLLLVTILILQASSLHLLDNVQAQIDALQKQQTRFQSGVNTLINNILQIEKSINRTSNIDEKVMILQKAIMSQREDIFKLSTVLIPPFNITKEGCEKMTDQQKVDLLDKLKKAKEQVNSFQVMASTMPQCSDVDMIKRDIEKQIFFLNSIESIIYTNCQRNVVLSPTIFQTNIYADGWVLGSMTIDDLIQQYYQRSIRYDNITNCPIEFPFFNGLNCINCLKTQVFDISTKQCVMCPPDSHVDNVKRICVANIHHTNWPVVQNYSPLEAPTLTVPQKDSTPCPQQKPYYTGKECIACVLPNYFNAVNNICQACPPNTKFNMNERICVEVLSDYYTNLKSDWLTGPGNFTNVINERANLLRRFPNIKICDPSTPYYDGIQCVPCPQNYQFDLNILRCVTPTNGAVFDPNIHNYLKPEPESNTNKNAPNLLGTPSYKNGLPDCPIQKPHYDGIACILCPSPYNLFDTNLKQCVACQPTQYYQNGKCVPRKTIYISERKDNLLSGPNRTAKQYIDQMPILIKENPQAIVGVCPPDQYTDFTRCIPCGTNQYFQVSSFRCVSCQSDEQYDKVNYVCKKKPIPGQKFTNFPVSRTRIIGLPPNQQSTEKAVMDKNPLNEYCPQTAPFKTNTGCVQCSGDKIFFDWATKTCVGCAANQYLDKAKMVCIKKQMFSNVDDFDKYKYVDPTKQVPIIKEEIAKLGDIPHNICPVGTPYYNDQQDTCQSIECKPNQVFSFETLKCIPCPVYNATTRVCQQAKPPQPPKPIYYPKLDSNWVATKPDDVIKMTQQLKSKPNSVECPAATPFYKKDTASCIACPKLFSYDTYTCIDSCPAGQEADLKTHTCITKIVVPPVYYPDLRQNWISTNPNQIITKTTTLSQKPGSVMCKDPTPHYDFNAGKCVPSCPTGQVYDYDSSTCKACDEANGFKYSPTSHQCVRQAQYKTNIYEAPNLLYGGKTWNEWKQIDSKNPNPPCPAPKYYYNGAQCVQCPQNYPYWNLLYNVCMVCPSGTTYQATSINVKECVDTSGNVPQINPDIAKMLSNIYFF